MAVTGTDAVSIVSIIYYLPAIAAVLYGVFTRGNKPLFIWLELGLFATLKLVGSILELVAAHETPVDTSLQTTGRVLTTAGLRFIFGATLGVLETSRGRYLKSNKDKTNAKTRPDYWCQLIILVGLILSVSGGSKLASAKTIDDANNAKDLLKGGAALYIVGLVILAGIAVWYLTLVSSASRTRKIAAVAGAICVPFLVVRVAYTAAVAFSPFDSDHFSLLNPDAVVEAIMSVLMEFIIFFILLSTGLLVQKRGIEEQQSSFGMDQPQTSNSQQSYPQPNFPQDAYSQQYPRPQPPRFSSQYDQQTYTTGKIPVRR